MAAPVDAHTDQDAVRCFVEFSFVCSLRAASCHVHSVHHNIYTSLGFFFSWQWLPLLKDELSCRPPIFFGRQVFVAGRDKDLSCVSSTHMFVHME